MANRYWVGGSANWDNTAGTKWSTTSGGAGGAAVPTSADDVFFDGPSGVNTITITATANAKSVTCTGFTGTLAGSSALNIAGNVTFVAGMTLSCTGTLSITAASTLNFGGKTWGGSMTWSGANAKVLASAVTISGTFIVSGATTVTGAFNINVGGGLTMSSTLSGTAVTIVLNGTGTWSGTSALSTNLTFNTAGTITLSGSIAFNTGTITYSAGTINPGTSTLTIASSTTLNTSGMSWYNVTASGTTTLTINSLLTVSNNLVYASGSVVTCTGTAGWTTATFDIQTSNNITHVLKSGNTYTITTNFLSVSTTNSLKDTIASSTTGVHAILTLNHGASQAIAFTNATDIDSSLGQAIYVANGTLSNTLNWNPLSATDMGGGSSFIYIN